MSSSRAFGGTSQAGNDARYVQTATVDAKGDLLAGTADNTLTRLAAGSNGQVLTAQSGQATGLLWAALTDTATVPAADATVGTSGSSGTAAPRDHAHPRYQWGPTDHGLLAWSMDLANCNANSVPATAGQLMLVRVHVPVAVSVTGIVMYATSAGSGLTSGQCFAGLWTAAGAKVGVTADQATAWAGNGKQQMALSGGPFPVSAGDVYVGLWFNGTTSPAWARGTNLGTSFVNIGLSAPNFRVATADTGLTNAASAPSTLGTQSAYANHWWCALY